MARAMGGCGGLLQYAWQTNHVWASAVDSSCKTSPACTGYRHGHRCATLVTTPGTGWYTGFGRFTGAGE